MAQGEQVLHRHQGPGVVVHRDLGDHPGGDVVTQEHDRDFSQIVPQAEIGLVAHAGEDDAGHPVFHKGPDVLILDGVVVEGAGDKDVPSLLPGQPLQVAGQLAEKGIGDVRHDDPDGPGVAALELPGGGVERVARCRGRSP